MKNYVFVGMLIMTGYLVCMEQDLGEWDECAEEGEEADFLCKELTQEEFEEHKIQALDQDLTWRRNNRAPEWDIWVWTTLRDAISCGQPRVVKYLADCSVPITLPNKYGYTALHVAADIGQRAIAEFLINCGANVNAKTDGEGRTPLHSAVSAKLPLAEIVLLLLNNKADVNARDYIGKTALHQAALQGNVEIVDLLLKHGAKINAQSDNGYTPLHSAVCRKPHNNSISLITTLLENGADPLLKTQQEETVFDFFNRVPILLSMNQEEIETCRNLSEICSGYVEACCIIKN